MAKIETPFTQYSFSLLAGKHEFSACDIIPKGKDLCIVGALCPDVPSLYEVLFDKRLMTIILYDRAGKAKGCILVTYTDVIGEPVCLSAKSSDILLEKIRLKNVTCTCYTYKDTKLRGRNKRAG